MWRPCECGMQQWGPWCGCVGFGVAGEGSGVGGCFLRSGSTDCDTLAAGWYGCAGGINAITRTAMQRLHWQQQPAAKTSASSAFPPPPTAPSSPTPHTHQHAPAHHTATFQGRCCRGASCRAAPLVPHQRRRRCGRHCLAYLPSIWQRQGSQAVCRQGWLQ